jgi:hypothetical protein
MKKENQKKLGVSLPGCFVAEAEEAYGHLRGPLRALTFPGFLGFLIGLGLHEYRKTGGAGEEGGDNGETAEPGRDYAFTPRYLRYPQNMTR